ncbi:MAG: 50S ribosomal protein L1, partial [Sulfolobales archaeon]|nr:50S ribosomal protein L1 [Sulfolobales archaeon]MDW8010270.1 50S ribosomal protein L1 [Sulfolobales archaeon]
VRQYNSSTWLRNREQNWVGCRIGTEDMSVEDLVENAMSVIEFVKGKIKRPLEGSVRIYVKTTMGPPVEVLYT